MPTEPRPPTCIEVPAGLFAPHRRPLFPLRDAIGDPATIDRWWLEDCGGETVRVASADAPAFRLYLRTHLRDILATDTVPATDRAWAAHRALLHELAYLFGGREGRAADLLEACRALAEFMRGQAQPDGLFRSLRVDAPQTPVVHGVETAIGAVAVAVADGQTATGTLAMIAAAGAVADAGMLDLPREWRERRAALTAMERKAVERHPGLTLRRMQGWGLVAPEVVRAVGHHHERWDGAGYPDRLAAGAIPTEARYLAIADTYSTLTVARRGMPRLSRGDALREMARSTGQFDPALLRILVQLLAGVAAGARQPDPPA